MAATVKKKFVVAEGLFYDINPEWERRSAPKSTHDPDRHLVYKKGEVVESERDLLKQFPNKFIPFQQEQVREATTARKAEVAELIDGGHWTEDDRAFLEGLSDDGFVRVQHKALHRPTPAGTQSGPLGEDVTHLYGRAYDEGLKVWRNRAGKHQVTAKGDYKIALNPKPLAEQEVVPFVERYLKEK